MQSYRWLAYLIFATLCGCAGQPQETTVCNEDDKDCTQRPKVETGGAFRVSECGALLTGKVDIDVELCDKISFGILYSNDSATLAGYEGIFVPGDVLYERDFSVEVPNLVKKTKYFYRARLFVNDTQYTYGDILSFSTMEGPCAFGPFSIANNKVVLFSPGNLQYKASTKTWRFAEQQYDFIGDYNAKVSNTYSGWIDLFGWGTGNNPIKTIPTDEDYSPFVDWGTNTIGTYSPRTWRTLSKEEWDYVFRLRANASQLYGLGTVKGVKGYILLPDKWNPSNGIKFTPRGQKGFAKNTDDFFENEDDNHWTDNVYSAPDWQKMEQCNAVFLPAAGMRERKLTRSVEFGGWYWSCTEGDGYNSAYSIMFDGTKCFTKLQIFRSFGYSVRLVYDYDGK